MITDILFLPHGMEIVPGVGKTPNAGFSMLDEKMVELSKSLASIPDHIIILTPHGYNLADKLVMYDHEVYHGNIYRLSEGSVVYGELLSSFDVNGSVRFNDVLFGAFDDAGIEVERLIHGFSGYPLKLNWGTSVPLYYLRERLFSKSVTILCYPRTRHTDLDQVVETNKRLAEAFQSLGKDIMLVISGDLSHVHSEEGPYGVDESAELFDTLVQRWAKGGSSSDMEELHRLQPNALACGMAGLDLIHVLRSKLPYDLRTSFYEVPTYFGMAGFHWSSEPASSQNGGTAPASTNRS